MYGDLSQDEILYKLGQLFEQFEVGEYNKTELVRDINTQVKRILKVATDYGFDDNLWHNYLTFFLMMSENPFSITCEKVGASDGSVNGLVANDFRIFKKLFDYDFKPIESALGIDCFTQISNYKAIVKKDLMYNHNVSEKVRALSKKLEAAKDEQEFFDVVTGFYKAYGVGMFGLNKAFRIEEHLDGGFSFMPINNMDAVMLDDLIGYEIQKKKLTDNTEAFVQGKKANNVLLFGDSGTGKSTSIKAIVNQYYDDGLRMIEIYKHQFKYLSKIIAAIKNRNYRFIIYMDDLSFEKDSLDLIWSEGAIYNIGFERGLKEWRNYLKPGGYLAVSESVWFTDQRPAEIHDFWMSAYTEIDTVPNKVAQIQKAGYIPVATFILPENCWIEHYFAPQAKAEEIFRRKHAGSRIVEELITSNHHEAELYSKYKAYYGYAFFICKKGFSLRR